MPLNIFSVDRFSFTTTPFTFRVKPAPNGLRPRRAHLKINITFCNNSTYAAIAETGSRRYNLGLFPDTAGRFNVLHCFDFTILIREKIKYQLCHILSCC